MSGRGNKQYFRKDNARPISAEDIYTMLMMHQKQKLSIARIARHFSLEPVQVRLIVGRRGSGSCCG